MAWSQITHAFNVHVALEYNSYEDETNTTQECERVAAVPQDHKRKESCGMNDRQQVAMLFSDFSKK